MAWPLGLISKIQFQYIDFKATYIKASNTKTIKEYLYTISYIRLDVL